MAHSRQRSSAPARAATPPRSTPPISACRSRSSTRRRTPAASASTAAASRRRRCCTSPRCSTRRSTPSHWGVDVRRAADRPRQAARLQEPGRREADQRHRPGGQARARSRYVQGRATIAEPTTLSVTDGGGRRRRSSVDYVILATGSQPTRIPGPVDRQPARARLDRRARPARDSQDAARHRRRLHRPGARLGLRRARHQGVGRRDDARPAARRRSRSGAAARPAHREDLREGDARRPRSPAMVGGQERHRGDLRGRRRAGAETYDNVLVSIGRRPNVADSRPRDRPG